MEENDKNVEKKGVKKPQGRKFSYSPYSTSGTKSMRKNSDQRGGSSESKKAETNKSHAQNEIELPKEIPVVALHDRPLFPKMVSPIVISGEVQLGQVREILDSGVDYFGFCLICEDSKAQNIMDSQQDEVDENANFQEIVEDSQDPDETLIVVQNPPIAPSRKIDTEQMHLEQEGHERLKNNGPTSTNGNGKTRTSMYRVGVVGKVVQVVPVLERPNSVQIVVKCLQRFTVLKVAKSGPIPNCIVRYWPSETAVREDETNANKARERKLKSRQAIKVALNLKEYQEEIKSYSVAIINTIRELVRLNPLFKEELSFLIGTRVLESPGMLADFTATLTTARPFELQEVLETKDIRERLEKTLLLIQRELEISKTQVQITKRIEEKVGKQQREFFLKEQLKEIQKELGLNKDDHDAIIDKYQQAANKLQLSKEALDRFNEEIEKLAILFPSTPEYNNTRSYLDLIIALPWGVFSQDNYNLSNARKELDSQHFGLKDVKDRIIEFISVATLKGKLAGNIILLVGPPGVGKTSIGKSIAKSLNREFFRFSVGGLRDEAEIKGHRRTYISAMPGKIIQALKICKTSNPVIMLDEIDKLIQSSHGDPASSLLEVLDPEQNKEFLDHYLDVRFDLSNVLFICTANTTDTIPAPMLDRMEVIDISGYIFEEKVQIARKYLIPKLLESHGLTEKQWNMDDETLKLLICDYAREAGVRSSEKNLKKLMRKAAQSIVESKDNSTEQEPAIEEITVNASTLSKVLGAPIFKEDELFGDKSIGVVKGLAYTTHGGAVLLIEANTIKTAKGGLKHTGLLGNVMVESTAISYNYIRSLLDQTDADSAKYFDEHEIHLHVPAGATPKDGPSAGITMASAIYSLIKKIPIRSNLAMTGEISLTGKVLPIGGIKEKILAAKRQNITDLIFPFGNTDDFERLGPNIKEGIRPYFVKTFEDVINIGFSNKE